MTGRIAHALAPTLTQPLPLRAARRGRWWPTTRPGTRCSSGRSARRVERTFADDIVARRRADRRAHRHVRRRARRRPAPEPLLPVPRDRRRDRRLGRAGRRHGRADRRARARARGPRGAELRHRAPRSRRSAPTARSQLGGTARRPCAAGHVLGERRAGGARPAPRRAGRPPTAPGGRPAQGQHGPAPAAAAARPERRPARRLRRHLPRQRVLRRSCGAAYEQAAAGRIPELPPVRDLLPLAHRPLDPRARSAGRRAPRRSRSSACTCPRACSATTRSRPRDAARRATLRSLNDRARRADRGLPARPTPTATPCLEARTPVDLEHEPRPARRPHLPPRPRVAVRRGRRRRSGSWGVETPHERILLCGAGARRRRRERHPRPQRGPRRARRRLIRAGPPPRRRRVAPYVHPSDTTRHSRRLSPRRARAAAARPRAGPAAS